MLRVSRMILAFSILLTAAPLTSSMAAADPFIGEIMMTGANFCPRGWAETNGQLLPIQSNQALFSLLGTTYGGDGRSNFGLPDLRGRVPLHMGQGAGLTNRPLGAKGGEERHRLNTAELPQHSHRLNASKNIGSESTVTGNVLANQSRRQKMYAPPDKTGLTTLHPSSIASTGNNQPHNTMQPFLTIRFCIALQGIYPSRN